MDKKVLKAEIRTVEGKKVKKLRAQGIVPANVYGKKIKSQSLQVNLKDFQDIYKEVGETGIIELEAKGEKRPVLVHAVQLNAKTDDVLHVDFHQVDLKEKIEAEVPVELTGESPAEKQSLGTVVQHVNEVKVEALPADLPEKFEVDISEMSEVDQVIYIKDLKFDKSKVEIKSDPDEILVKVEPPQKEEEVAPVAPAEGEVPAEGTAAQGEAPAEGASQEAPQEETQK